ncbi:DUF1036 domain-containing protein [Actinoplanes subglobosus]|uniref:DUF1036 domain-containing protein n=1 Tax=Actinoplanes subglobosus TaxID=1547892 RepID=A0ABV8IW63_9ACTN
MRTAGALLAAGATLSVAVLGIAGPARASDYNRPVNICNYSNKKAAIARVLDSAGGMVSRGWTHVENGQCKVLDARFLLMQVYGDRDTVWRFDTFSSQFCAKSESYVIYSPGSASACTDTNGSMRSFSSVPAGSGRYDFNLRP